MIRWIVLIAIALAFMIFISHGAFAHSVDKNGKAYIYIAEKVDIAPAVDGILDEKAWQDAEKVALEWDILNDQPWKDLKDFKGSFGAVWKGSKLYVAVWLEDNQIDTSNKIPSESDSIELYIDRKHYAGELDKYTIVVGQKRDSKNFSAAWSGDGRAAEFVFDLVTVPKFGEITGFDIYYNDAESGHRQNQVGWTPGDNNKDAANLGDLVFAEPKKVREKRLNTTWGAIKTLY